MKRDGDNTETRALAHTSHRPVHPTLFTGQFGPRNLGAELKWRKNTKMVRKGKRVGKRDKARVGGGGVSERERDLGSDWWNGEGQI